MENRTHFRRVNGELRLAIGQVGITEPKVMIIESVKTTRTITQLTSNGRSIAIYLEGKTLPKGRRVELMVVPGEQGQTIILFRFEGVIEYRILPCEGRSFDGFTASLMNQMTL